jgi:hypothetical protein
MGAAEVVAFEEVCARKQWGALRRQLHGGVGLAGVAVFRLFGLPRASLPSMRL